jgi:hypothetical protein
MHFNAEESIFGRFWADFGDAFLPDSLAHIFEIARSHASHTAYDYPEQSVDLKIGS